MKRPLESLALFAWFAFFLLLSPARATSFTPAEAEVVMEDRAFLVKLEPGIRRAKLEVLDESTGNWVTFSIAHLAGDEGMIKLRLPDDVALERCRVQVSTSDPFPYSYYQTTTEYSQEEARDNLRLGGDAAFDAEGPAAPSGDEDTVQESDLWQWRGDTLYFFNQTRGLQVFDMTQPADPEHLGTLRMPNIGDQMYVLDDQHVLLLANYVNFHHYFLEDWAFVPWDVGGSKTEAILVRHDGEALEVVNRIPFNGRYVESRLVGQRLYLVTQTSGYVDTDGEYIYQSGLNAFQVDYTDPQNPVNHEPLVLSDDQGYYWNAVVTASPQHLLIVPSFWDSEKEQTRSRVHVIPIGRAMPLEVTHEVELRSYLPDKFKLRVQDGILTTVSQSNNWRDDLTTYVESFDLTSADGELKCDELILAPRERLHATRFYGDRLYVVTFFVEILKDPLFVIDLSDPKNLKSLGELEIPGWSTYLELFGDNRLLSIGLEDGNVAVSLFDVSDPDNPSLSARVYPGEGQTWSEATWDEKAVGFVPGQNLLLLPLNTWQETETGSSYRNLIQLIDVTEADLVVRGEIEHSDQGRRAQAVDQYVASISARELIVVDASDRDDPQVVATEELSWNADRVVAVDRHLLQIESGYAWSGNASNARIRVTTKEKTDEAIGLLELGPGAVTGHLLDGPWLYVARSGYASERVEVPVDDPSDGQDDHPDGGEKSGEWKWVYKTNFSVDVIDLSDPAEPALTGTFTEVWEGDTYEEISQLEGLILPSGDLVWYPRFEEFSYGGWWGWGGPVADVAFGPDVAFGWWGSGYSSAQKVTVYRCTVSDKTAPALAESESIAWKDWREVSETVLHDGQLYFTSKEYRWEHDSNTRDYHLHRFDLDGPLTAHEPVSVPGMLQGVYQPAEEGIVLFTTAPEMEAHEVGDSVFNRRTYWYATSNTLLQASVFDGENAFLVTETLIPNGRYSATHSFGPHLIKPLDEPGGLRVWTWTMGEENSTFETTLDIPLEEVPRTLASHGDLLLAQAGHTVYAFPLDALPEMPSTLALPLSGPVSTQNLRQVATSADGLCLHLATGPYGVETLDISALENEDEPVIAAQTAETWEILRASTLPLVHASGEDFVGPLASGQDYRFRSFAGLASYGEWALAHFNPCGDDLVVPGPEIDSDGDGAANLVEFAFLTEPNNRHSVATMTLDYRTESGFWALPVPAELDARGLSMVVEESANLIDWEPAETASFEEDGQWFQALSTDTGAPAFFYRTRWELSGPAE